jgi:L-ascorbate metabolism protein UlaG (beta-lactamase superfamily)
MSDTKKTVPLPQRWKVDKAILLFTLVMLLSGTSSIAQTESSTELLQQIRAHNSGIAVWWTGQNGWLIKLDDLLISTDLVLEERERISPPPISASDLAPELDISFVTHEHGDHFHPPTSRVLARDSRCIFVVPRNCVKKARGLGVPEDRIQIASPRQPFELEGIEVKPLRAIHGNPSYAVHAKANLEDCGYLINFQGRSIFQPGDSVLLEDHLFLQHVDVLFFSPTVHNTHIDRSVILINQLAPDYILPQHRSTYRETPQNQYWTHAYVEEVKWLLSESLQQRYHVLEPGERLLIE